MVLIRLGEKLRILLRTSTVLLCTTMGMGIMKRTIVGGSVLLKL